MITAERKPLSEIKEMIAPYKKILVVGCGTCVAECASVERRKRGFSLRPSGWMRRQRERRSR